VPATEVVEAALRASRKVNDYATAVRVLEGVKEKVENKLQYQAYLDELKPVIQELGECRITETAVPSLRTTQLWLTYVLLFQVSTPRKSSTTSKQRPIDR
jgi:hypothetical protein